MRLNTDPTPVLTVSVVSEAGALDALRPEWQQLHAAAGADIFLSWDWLVPWWRHLGQDRQLFILLARDESGQARGLLALSLGEARVGLRRVRRLRFLGDSQVGSDYLDALIEPGWRQTAIQAFAAALKARRETWDMVELRDMDEHSTTPHELLDGLGEEFAMRSEAGPRCPGQDFAAGQSPADFMKRTRRFGNYARRRKWMERQDGFRIDVCRERGELGPAADVFFKLHRLRWREDGGSSGIDGDRAEAFHRDAMARLLASGNLRLYTLWVNGHAIASVYALTLGRTFYYYQAGMDPAWRSRSAGLVLIGETFADAIRSGFTRYDFLRGEEAYKFDWVDDNRQLVGWRLFSNRGSGARAVRRDVRFRQGKATVKNWIRHIQARVWDSAR